VINGTFSPERRVPVVGRRLGVAFGVLALAVAVGGVLASGGSAAHRSTTGATLTSTGTAAVTYMPENALLTFGATTHRTSADTAISVNANAMNAIIAALKQAGAREISTTGLSLSVVYNRDGTAVTGFAAANSVQAKTAADQVGSLIDAAVAAGATTIGNPSFGTDRDLESLYRTALRNAVLQARQRATVLADAAGVTLGRLVSVQPQGSSPAPQPASVQTAGPTPVLPSAQDVTATATLIYEIG
jgi:uncharacterized protein